MPGNALEIPDMGLRTPIRAIFPPQFSYSIASSSRRIFTGCISFTVMLRTDNQSGHGLTMFLEVRS
jgi:hypothetical protein